MFWVFMYWSRVIFILAVASLLIFSLTKILKNKEPAIFLNAYIVSTLIHGFTGFSFNIFHDNFDIILFIKDVLIWTLSYFGARLFVTKFTKKSIEK